MYASFAWLVIVNILKHTHKHAHTDTVTHTRAHTRSIRPRPLGNGGGGGSPDPPGPAPAPAPAAADGRAAAGGAQSHGQASRKFQRVQTLFGGGVSAFGRPVPGPANSTPFSSKYVRACPQTAHHQDGARPPPPYPLLLPLLTPNPPAYLGSRPRRP
jgi:hypothetical protein